MLRLSFGVNGEFFIESSDELSKGDIDTVEELYKRIMTARQECIILAQANQHTEDD